MCIRDSFPGAHLRPAAWSDDGVIEVTLLGQNVNRYGKGLGGGANLATLLRRLGQIDGLRWSLPPGTRWPALWTGLFLLAGWLTFISMNGGEAAWRLLLGGKP